MRSRLFHSILLGIGFDCQDGHKRITKGDNFYLYGGSKETHQAMQEKALLFNEQLKKRKKTIDEIGNREFYEISRQIGLETPYTNKKKT